MKQQNTSFWDDAPFPIENDNGIKMHSLLHTKRHRKDSLSDSSVYKILMEEVAALNADRILEEAHP